MTSRLLLWDGHNLKYLRLCIMCLLMLTYTVVLCIFVLLVFKLPGGRGEYTFSHNDFGNPYSQTMGMKYLNKITANIFSIYTQTNSPHRLQAYQTPDYIITLGKGHFQKCSRLLLGPPFGVDLGCLDRGLLFSPSCFSEFHVTLGPQGLYDCGYPHFLVFMNSF